jgi:predicted nuclease with TOPRIM domain
MPPPLKVFVTPIGLDEVAVAVTSQKAALAAFGVNANLFGEGAAHITHDVDLIKHALARPGEIVRRRIDLSAIDRAPKRAAKSAPVRKAPPEPKRDLAAEREAKAAVKAAEKELERFERETKQQLESFEEERSALDERETRFKTGVAARRKRLKDALAAAKRDLP